MSDDIAARARRRTTAVVAAGTAVVLVVLAAVAGVVLLVGHRADPVSPSVPVGPPVAGPTGGTPGQQSRPPARTAPSTPATDDLMWFTVLGARVPMSRSAGPRDSTGGRARGFAQTPLGAVLAAAHITLRLSPQAGPAVFEATLREQVVGGDSAALGQRLAEDYEQARAQLGLPYGEPAGRLYSTARGYRVETDSANAATVRLLIEGPGKSGSVLVVLTLHTQWVGTDWALVAPPGGTWDTTAMVVTDSSNYTRFPDGG